MRCNVIHCVTARAAAAAADDDDAAHRVLLSTTHGRGQRTSTVSSDQRTDRHCAASRKCAVNCADRLPDLNDHIDLHQKFLAWLKRP